MSYIIKIIYLYDDLLLFKLVSSFIVD